MQRAWFTPNRAELLTVGTGLVVGEGLGLPFEQGGQDAFEQALGGDLGGLLEGEQVDVEAGAWLAKGAAGNNLAPLVGKIMEMGEVRSS